MQGNTHPNEGGRLDLATTQYAPRVTDLSGRGANLGTRVCNPMMASMSYARRRSESVRTSRASVNSPHHPAHVFSAISTSCSWHYWAITAVWKWYIVNAWDTGSAWIYRSSSLVLACLGQSWPVSVPTASTCFNPWHILRRHETPKQGPGAELSHIAALVWVHLGRTFPVSALLGQATWKWHWCG